MKKTFVFILISLISFYLKAQNPNVAFGSINRIHFKSKFVDARNVDVWLPPNYSTQKKYAVVYMHDGQMLFDSTTTWNKQSWKVAENMKLLLTNASIKECIVVGIWNNSSKRFVEYFPKKALNYLQSNKDTFGMYSRVGNFNLLADDYLKFIVQELKPSIDSSYSTLTNAANTFIVGSSMGGLISIYALCEYPNVFGGAACLSTHYPILYSNLNNPFPNLIFKYIKNNLPTPIGHKIYFDYGSATLDSLYKPHQMQVDFILKQKKYTNKNWLTKAFVGDDHSEKSWSKRLYFPLQFLLKK